MGIFGQEVRREFIARPDTAKGQILFKWPDTNIRKLTQLTVEQDELAVFFRDGRVQGTIQPGRVTLDSSEIPFLGILVDAASGGSLFRTELYFISTREFPNLPFGGAVEIHLRPFDEPPGVPRQSVDRSKQRDAATDAREQILG